MKISPAKTRPKQKKTCISEPECTCPVGVSRFENIIEMDGMGEAWLSQMEEEDTLFNMQDWESKDRMGKDRKKTR